MQIYEIVIVLLVVLVLALLTANVVIGRSSIKTSAEQYPPGLGDLLKDVLTSAINLATITPTRVDDEALKVLASASGYRVTSEANGRLILERVTGAGGVAPNAGSGAGGTPAQPAWTNTAGG